MAGKRQRQASSTQTVGSGARGPLGAGPIFVAGHRGLVGQALKAQLESSGHTNLLVRTSQELDLRRQAEVEALFNRERPQQVYVVAGRVGGIIANNTLPADFLYDNVMIATNVLHAAAAYGAEKVLYVGSSCIYPRLAPQPIKESSLLDGPLEKTNEGYALAKIVGIKLCEYFNRQHGKNFISAMPCNLYGINDNFHPEHSHVIPGMMRRFHEAKARGDRQVVIWGTGRALREFLFVDDLATALPLLMERYSGSETVNVGSGLEISIAELARTMADVTGFRGALVFDTSKPDGTPRKILDSTKIRDLGWQPTVSLREGLARVYEAVVKAGVFDTPDTVDKSA